MAWCQVRAIGHAIRLTHALVWLACVTLMAFAPDASAQGRRGSATVPLTDPQTCESEPTRVWVKTPYGPACVEYFFTRGGAASKRAVIYFQGDYLPDELADAAKARARLARTQSMMERLAERYDMRFVIIARPGTLGTSGNQAQDKHRQRELFAMNQMIDIVKERLGLERVALAGQSGGSYVLAGILANGRSDIACAAAGSGVYSLTDRWRSLGQGEDTIQRNLRGASTGNPWYSPKEEADRIVPDRQRRIFVIGDQFDGNATYSDQTKYVQRVSSLGHHVRQLRANGIGDKRHGLTHITLSVAGWCLGGVPDDAIAWGVDRLGPSPVFDSTDGR